MANLLEEKAAIESRLLAADPACQKFLYHGTSYSKPLQFLEPRPSRTMVEGISGDFVFAADSFVAALIHANKVPVNDGRDFVGVNVFRSFTGASNHNYANVTTSYGIICRLDEFNALGRGGYVYAVKPDGFEAHAAGEYTSEVAVPPVYRLRVGGLSDLMEVGVQLFALRDAAQVDEFSYNWPLLNDDNERAFILDTESKKPDGLFRWLNKEEGYEIPDGPMKSW